MCGERNVKSMVPVTNRRHRLPSLSSMSPTAQKMKTQLWESRTTKYLIVGPVHIVYTTAGVPKERMLQGVWPAVRARRRRAAAAVAGHHVPAHGRAASGGPRPAGPAHGCRREGWGACGCSHSGEQHGSCAGRRGGTARPRLGSTAPAPLDRERGRERA